MKSLLFLLIGTFSYQVFAAELIVDEKLISELEFKSAQNAYYQKMGPIKVNFNPTSLGRPQTPFYYSGIKKDPSRYFKNGAKCFEVTINESQNQVKNQKCSQKIQELRAPGYPDFHPVLTSELYQSGLKSFVSAQSVRNYKILGYLHADERGVDQSKFPKQHFGVELSTKDQVILGESELSFTQEINLTAERFGLLNPKKTKKISHSVSTLAGDLIFTDGQGKVIVYKNSLPSVFKSQMLLNKELPSALDQLTETSKVSPVCYLDPFVGDKDCFRLVFDSRPLANFQSFKFMAIDFNRMSVNFTH